VIGFGNFPTDWGYNNYQNPNLWQGVNGTNNPCPAGYRLPTEIELETERISWISNDGAGAIASPLKLPLPGYRVSIHELGIYNAGSLRQVGCTGFYWSSTANFSPKALMITSFVNDTGIYQSERIAGFSVRCIKN
jgi:hypothetical protein